MKKFSLVVVVSLILALVLTSCVAPPAEKSAEEPAAAEEMVEEEPVADEAAEEEAAEEPVEEEPAAEEEDGADAPSGGEPTGDLLEDYALLGEDITHVEPEDFEVGDVDEEYTIGIAAGTMGSSFFKIIVDMAQEELEAHGAKVVLADANGSFETQTKQIENFITQGVDAMIVNATDPPSAISEVLQKAADKGIPVVGIDSMLDDNFHNYLCVVGSDNYQLGYGVGEFVVEQLKEKHGELTGTIAVMDGVEGNVAAVGRYDGFWAAINEADPDHSVEEVSHLYGGSWTEEAGIQMAGDLFVAHPDVDVIFGISDPFVVAATAEAERAGIDDVIMTAVDGAKSALKIIADDGTIKAIGLNDPIRMGKAGARVILAYLSNGTLPESRKTLLTPLVATPDNIDEMYNPDSPF